MSQKRKLIATSIVLNAGVMGTPYSLTSDGIENQIAINHFGHFAFTMGLLPLLVPTDHARVVVVSSHRHTVAPSKGGIDFASLESINRPLGSTWERYGALHYLVGNNLTPDVFV